MPAWQCPAWVGRSRGHRRNNLPQDSELRPVHPEAPALPNLGARLPPAPLFSLPQFQHTPSPPQQRLPGGSSIQEPAELEGPPLLTAYPANAPHLSRPDPGDLVPSLHSPASWGYGPDAPGQNPHLGSHSSSGCLPWAGLLTQCICVHVCKAEANKEVT